MTTMISFQRDENVSLIRSKQMGSKPNLANIILHYNTLSWCFPPQAPHSSSSTGYWVHPLEQCRVSPPFSSRALQTMMVTEDSNPQPSSYDHYATAALIGVINYHTTLSLRPKNVCRSRAHGKDRALLPSLGVWLHRNPVTLKCLEKLNGEMIYMAVWLKCVLWIPREHYCTGCTEDQGVCQEDS